MKRSQLVTFFRGYAMITIVLMHLVQGLFNSGALNNCLSFGGSGVHLFILCSGFGLYLSHLNHPIGYARFLKTRFFRVYLPYAIVVVISFLTPFYFASPHKFQWLLSHLLLYKMFFSEYIETLGVQLWFVSTIIQFYIAWPLIVALFEKGSRKGRWLPIGIALAISLGWSTIVLLTHHGDLRNWGSFFLQYLWEFVLGMYMAKWYKDRDAEISIPRWYWFALAAAIAMPATYLMATRSEALKLYNDIPSMIGYTSLAVLIYKARVLNRLVEWFSPFSYEWYLVHIYCFNVVAYALGLSPYDGGTTAQKLTYAALSLALSIIAAIGYHSLINAIYRHLPTNKR